MAAPGERDPIRIITKVTQLIALASSPHEEEARSAAFLACHLIREHKLVVTSQLLPRATPFRPSPAPSPPPKPRAEPEKTEKPSPDQPSDEAQKKPVSINAKFPGVCLICGDRYAIGERVLWSKGRGCVHVGCAKERTKGSFWNR